MKLTNRVKTNFILFFIALIWGSSFIAQRAVANELSPFLFNGFRFLLGGIAILPFAPRPWKLEIRWLPIIILTGGMLFGGSLLQQEGMKTTTAGNAAFITSLYVVLVPIISTIAFRKKVSKIVWIAAIMAVTGAYLLSSGEPVNLSSGVGLELIGAVLWALHLILVGYLANKVNPAVLTSIQLLFGGILNLVLGSIVGPVSWPAVYSSLWAIIYSGIFSMGLCFTLQAFTQKSASPADAAIILSMESVFAALFGFLFLGEVLGFSQISGCGLIFSATLIAQRTSA